MIDWFIKFSTDTFLFNSLLGFFIYWVPLAFCVFGYTIRTFKNYSNDLTKRKEWENGTSKSLMYHPTDTLGDIIGRGFVSIIPICNIWAGCFDLCPEVLGSFFKWIARIFDQPLVPERKDRRVEKNEGK